MLLRTVGLPDRGALLEGSIGKCQLAGNRSGHLRCCCRLGYNRLASQENPTPSTHQEHFPTRTDLEQVETTLIIVGLSRTVKSSKHGSKHGAFTRLPLTYLCSRENGGAHSQNDPDTITERISSHQSPAIRSLSWITVGNNYPEQEYAQESSLKDYPSK